MLRKTTDLIGFDIHARDGDVGRVDDLYFDDNEWTIRYFVVNTGPWLFGKQVLVAPEAFAPPTWSERAISVDLTQEQVEKSPDIDLDQPVSRQQEMELRSYYRWPAYWAATPAHFSRTTVGAVAPVAAPVIAEEAPPAEDASAELGDPNLRSTNEVTGYGIHATDGEIGHVEDFFVDEHDWRIHLVMIDTRNWLPGKKVLISPDWIERVSWDDSKVHVRVDREQVRNSAEYDPKRYDEGNSATGLYTYFNMHL